MQLGRFAGGDPDQAFGARSEDVLELEPLVEDELPAPEPVLVPVLVLDGALELPEEVLPPLPLEEPVPLEEDFPPTPPGVEEELLVPPPAPMLEVDEPPYVEPVLDELELDGLYEVDPLL